ncbi:MAG: hypothetical protein WC817_04260 [Patescibacteria group bacterium]|jgi:hypothetical protein
MHLKKWIVIPHLGISLLIIMNACLWRSSEVGLILGIVYLAFYGYVLGECWSRTLSSFIRFISGLLLTLTTLAGLGGIVYYLIGLPNWLATIVLVVIASSIVLLNSCIAEEIRPTPDSIIPQSQHGRMQIMVAFIGALALAFAFSFLFKARTGEALRSPWSVVDARFFGCFFIAEFSALLLLWTDNKRRMLRDFFVLSALTTLATTIGIIVYRVGFGFDPFIHQATESLIATAGVVYPKPLYYLGQYALVVLLHTLTLQPIAIIDSLLLPAVTGLALPALFITTFYHDNNKRTAALSAATFIGMPLYLFAMTTPQGIANLLFVAVIFLGYRNDCDKARTNRQFELLLLGLSVTAMVMHPLAGLPALFFVGLRYMQNRYPKQNIIYSLAAIAAAAVLPIIFFMQNAGRAGVQATATLPTIPAEQLSRGILYFGRHYNFILDTVYLYAFNLGAIIIALLLIGIYLLKRQEEGIADNKSLLLISLILFFDAFIVKFFIPFLFLIDYERSNFSGRLFTLGFIALLPFAVIALRSFFERLTNAPRSVIVFFLLTLSCLATISVYVAYPRFDTYAFDRGYSTSLHDITAVRYIDSVASGSYVVLADQAVAAAALKELGFKQYFARQGNKSNEQIFFYPIPTGGSLYQEYLRMVYEKPTRDPIRSALTMTGANEAYFVLNDYWFDFENIRDSAKQFADDWKEIDGGKIVIFHYKKL